MHLLFKSNGCKVFVPFTDAQVYLFDFNVMWNRWIQWLPEAFWTIEYILSLLYFSLCEKTYDELPLVPSYLVV